MYHLTKAFGRQIHTPIQNLKDLKDYLLQPSNFTESKNWSPENEVVCPRSHSSLVTELGLHLGSPNNF